MTGKILTSVCLRFPKYKIGFLGSNEIILVVELLTQCLAYSKLSTMLVIIIFIHQELYSTLITQRLKRSDSPSHESMTCKWLALQWSRASFLFTTSHLDKMTINGSFLLRSLYWWLPASPMLWQSYNMFVRSAPFPAAFGCPSLWANVAWGPPLLQTLGHWLFVVLLGLHWAWVLLHK